MPSSKIHRNGEILECPRCKNLFIRLPDGHVMGSCGHDCLKQIVGVLPDGELDRMGVDGVLSELEKQASERRAAIMDKVRFLVGSPSVPASKAPKATTEPKGRSPKRRCQDHRGNAKIGKKIRCFTVKSDYDGYDVKSMKHALEDFGLHVSLGELESQDRHNPDCDVVVSDLPLSGGELAEIREFWPPACDWSGPPTQKSPNRDNDVK